MDEKSNVTDNIRYLMQEYRQEIGDSSKHGGGNPPGGGGLESRVSALEKAIPDLRERLVRVEMRLDSIESSMATKTDLAALASKDDLNGFVRASSKDIQDLAVSFQKAINEQTWKFVSVAAALAGLAFTAAKFIH
ncbi:MULTISPECIES: hypothetical protein [unclassified Pseudomonas]|uniref:hypothetical protein n=1 Tax=unclassified Pseudomonas TaxID=196821 RepID=UPI000A1E39FE|nr:MULTISPECIES: hypothetical protein [unclassified Pseudomonas]